MIKFIILILALSTSSWGSEWKKKIIEDANILYKPVAIENFKKPLRIIIKEDHLAFASADHNDDELRVSINSGLLNSKRLTPDSLRMIVCHELGHLFGGAPRRNVPFEWDGPMASDGLSLLSSEGQADYYAALICFKKIIAHTQAADEPLPDLSRAGPVFKKKCQASTMTSAAYRNCLRAGIASLDFLNLVKDFDISCERTDPSQAETLIRDAYPAKQCRLDTMINGTICHRDLPLALDFNHAEFNDCDAYSARPLCWYPN